MKVSALVFVLSSFTPLHHGLRIAQQNWVTPAWVNSIPELPQGPEEVLSLETLERNDLLYHGTLVFVCNLLDRLPVEVPPQSAFARRSEAARKGWARLQEGRGALTLQETRRAWKGNRHTSRWVVQALKQYQEHIGDGGSENSFFQKFGAAHGREL